MVINIITCTTNQLLINDLPSIRHPIKHALLIRNIDDSTGSGEVRLNCCEGTSPIAKSFHKSQPLYNVKINATDTSIKKPFVIERNQ